MNIHTVYAFLGKRVRRRREDPRDPTIPHASDWNDCGDVLTRLVYTPSQLWDKTLALSCDEILAMYGKSAQTFSHRL